MQLALTPCHNFFFLKHLSPLLSGLSFSKLPTTCRNSQSFLYRLSNKILMQQVCNKFLDSNTFLIDLIAQLPHDWCKCRSLSFQYCISWVSLPKNLYSHHFRIIWNISVLFTEWCYQKQNQNFLEQFVYVGVWAFFFSINTHVFSAWDIRNIQKFRWNVSIRSQAICTTRHSPHPYNRVPLSPQSV